MSVRRLFGSLPLRRFALCKVALASLALYGCTTPDPSNTQADSAVDARTRDVDFSHDNCNPDASSKTVDVNGDQRPDIVHVMKDGHEMCRIVDLNFDGAVDAYIYFDDKGAERRREEDFDRDGRPDQITVLQGGQLAEKHRETNFDDKIDTWDYYQSGVLVRRERDSDGDAIIDQWWTFYDPARPRCATVASDRNADGKPDADSQVDLCGTGYVSPGAAPSAPPGAPPAGAPPEPGKPPPPAAATATAAPSAAPPPPAPSP